MARASGAILSPSFHRRIRAYTLHRPSIIRWINYRMTHPRAATTHLRACRDSHAIVTYVMRLPVPIYMYFTFLNEIKQFYNKNNKNWLKKKKNKGKVYYIAYKAKNKMIHYWGIKLIMHILMERRCLSTIRVTSVINEWEINWNGNRVHIYNVDHKYVGIVTIKTFPLLLVN